MARPAGHECISSLVGGSWQEASQPQQWAVMDATGLLKGHLEVETRFPVVSAIIYVRLRN